MMVVAIVTATLMIAAAIGAQAEPEIKTETASDGQSMDASISVAPRAEVREGAVDSSITQSSIPPVAYPRQQSEKTIQFRSIVQDVRVTGFVITADDQVKVSLTYIGTQKSPAVTIVVSTEWIPIPTYVMGPTVMEPEVGVGQDAKPGYYPYPSPYPSLVGSNIMKEAGAQQQRLSWD